MLFESRKVVLPYLLVLMVTSTGAFPAGLAWSTQLNFTTSNHSSHSADVYAGGYNLYLPRLDLYLATDLNKTLYALNASNGDMLWFYNRWPEDVPAEAFSSRVIAGGDREGVWLGVLLGSYLLIIDPVLGTLISRVSFPANVLPLTLSYLEGSMSFVIVGTGQLFVCSPTRSAYYPCSTFDSLYTVNLAGMNGNQATICEEGPGATNIAAIVNSGSNDSSQVRVKLVVLKTQRLERMVLPTEGLNTTIDPSLFNYLFQVTQHSVFYFTLPNDGASSVIHRVPISHINQSIKPSNRENHLISFSVTIPWVIQGYGLGWGADVFYFHFTSHAAAFNRTTGALIGRTLPMGPNVTHIDRILGFEDFVVLALHGPYTTLNVTAWNCNAMNGTHRWSLQPPSPAFSNMYRSTDRHSLIFPQDNGFSALNPYLGLKSFLNGTNMFDELDAQSMVMQDGSNGKFLLFTFGSVAARINF